MILFNSDGAAVMLGVNNGVHVKLKEHCPHLIESRHVAHHDTLADGQAYQPIDYYVHLENSHFSHSRCCLENLKEVFYYLIKSSSGFIFYGFIFYKIQCTHKSII